MLGYAVRRTTWSIIVVATVAVVAFALTFLAPADPARAVAGAKPSAAEVERIRASLGLDRPALEQLAGYLLDVARLDLGVSYQSGGLPVFDLIVGRLPATLELAIAGVALGLAIGLPLGVASAVRPGSRLDRAGAVVAAIMASMPSFFVGLVLIWVFAIGFRTWFGLALFPIANTDYHPLDLRGLALPALTVALATAPYYLRIARVVMLDELRADYVRTARAKGLPDRAVVWRHAFRNSVPQIVTMIGLDVGFLLGGIVVVEAVFSWPGIGQMAARSINAEDIPLLMGTLVFGTVCVVLANLVVDLVCAALDPRILDARG
jgi:peptide/nickel transport system permease protein